MGITVKALVSGIFIWAIAFVIELLRGAPSSSLWICVLGAGLGVVGLIYSIRRLRREGAKD